MSNIVKIASKNPAGCLNGFLSKHSNIQSKSAIVVIQEWWGMNAQIKTQAKAFSEKWGYTTLVPDLYRGKVAQDNEEAGHLMSGLDWEGAVCDIEASVNYLKAEQGAQKVGTIGFCMGGALSLAAAIRLRGLACAVVFYGIPSESLASPKNLTTPTQFHFGAYDKMSGFSSPVDAQKLRKVVEERAKSNPHEFYLDYAAEHAFANSSRPEVYNERETEKAYKRAQTFFNAHFQVKRKVA